MNFMLLKRLTALLMCLITVSATVYYACTYRFFDKILSDEQKEAFCKETSLPNGFLLAASAQSFNNIKNSEESVISNLRSGSFAIELNVAFTDDGIPVLSDGPEYVTDDAVTLESVFERFKNKDYLRYLINIRERADYSVFNGVVKKFSLANRIIVSGFSFDDIDFMSNQLYSYRFCPELTFSGNLSDPVYCSELAAKINDYGLTMIRINADDITEEFANAVSEETTASLIVDGADSSYEMYYSLSLNPGGIISKDPHKFYSILVEQNFLDYKR